MKTRKHQAARKRKTINCHRKRKIYYGGDNPITSIEGIPEEIFNDFQNRFPMTYNEKRPGPFKLQLKSQLGQTGIDSDMAASLTDKFIEAMKFNKSLQDASNLKSAPANVEGFSEAATSLPLVKTVEGVSEEVFQVIQNKFKNSISAKKPPSKLLLNQIRDLFLNETGVSQPTDEDYLQAFKKATEIATAITENNKLLESSPFVASSQTASSIIKEEINPEIMEGLQKSYNTNPMKEMARKVIEAKLNSLANENKISKTMVPVYLAALKEKKEIDITQPKFKQLYALWSCNRACLTNSIPILSKGLDFTKEEANKFEDVIRNSNQLQKLYPEIEDSCGPKTKSSSTSSQNSTSESESDESNKNYTTMSYENLESALKKVKLEIALEGDKKIGFVSSNQNSYINALNNYIQLASTAGYSYKTITDSLKRNTTLLSRNNINLSQAFETMINAKNIEHKSRTHIQSLVDEATEITKYLYIKYVEYYRNEYNRVINLLNKTEPLDQKELIAVEKAETYLTELNEALDTKTFLKLIIEIEEEAKRNASKERKVREDAERAAAKAKQLEELKKERDAEKMKYIDNFKERNKENKEGLDFLNKILKATVVTSNFYPQFAQYFPNENPEDFWRVVFGKTLKRPAADQKKREPKQKFVPPVLQLIPSIKEKELNKQLFNFELKNNQFYDKGKPVDVYGRPVPLIKGGKKTRRRKNKKPNRTYLTRKHFFN